MKIEKVIRNSLPRLLLLVLIGLLVGCAVSTPYPKLSVTDAAQPDDKVVLVITKIVLKTESDRSEFDRQTNRLIDTMSTHPGLIGFSARKELLGHQAWTLSVWKSDADRVNFVNSGLHQTAIKQSSSAIGTAEFKRLLMARKELPNNWNKALDILAEPGGLRNYWD
jgi:heme-degrading monooxygenase HmoA